MTARTLTGFLALCERESLRVLKIWSQTIAAPTLTALLYLGVFGLSLGSRIGSIGGDEYMSFIIPGVVLMLVATQSYNNNSASTFQGRSDGYIEDILSAPLHSWQIAVAILWGGVLRSMLIAASTLALTATFADVSIKHPFQAFLLLLLVSILWGSIGTIAGVYAQSFDQHMLIGNLVITPLVFVGGIFYSVRMLPSPLDWMTRIDPLFYEVNGLRHTFLGHSDVSLVTASLLTISLGAIAFCLQIWLFQTGHRLKN